jgi:hypothetical protein
MNECLVCNDPVQWSTPCGHSVHQECIARSGKEECPVCRAIVKLDVSYAPLLTSAQKRNREAEEERNREAAQQLQETVPAERVHIGGRVLRWREAPTGRLDIDSLFTELSRLNFARHNEEVTCSKGSLDLLALVYSAREVCAVNNLSMREVTDIILTVFEE